MVNRDAFERLFLFLGDKMKKTESVMRSVDELIPYANNARTHTDKQITQIASSIKKFGFNNYIVIDDDNMVLAGHGRLEAAKKLKLTEVPCILARDLSDAEKKAYIIADNKLAENAGWDEELLTIELEDLKDEGFNLDVIGFDDKELLNLLEPEEEEENESKYTDLVGTPQYEITGENPPLSQCCDSNKTEQLIREIEESSVSEEEKEFLIKAAYRHAAFHYGKVAEYYAEASPEMQSLMEKSALVIIDMDNAIENGFVHMTKQLREILDDADK